MANKEVATTYSVKAFLGRGLPDNYRNFILARWLRSFRFGNNYIKLIDSGSYYKAYSAYIKSLLESPLVAIRLAVISDEPDVALGFSVISGQTLHYVYVGKDYRHNGIGLRLVPIKVMEFTHLTNKGMALWNRKAPKAIFNPFH